VCFALVRLLLAAQSGVFWPFHAGTYQNQPGQSVCNGCPPGLQLACWIGWLHALLFALLS